MRGWRKALLKKPMGRLCSERENVRQSVLCGLVQQRLKQLFGSAGAPVIGVRRHTGDFTYLFVWVSIECRAGDYPTIALENRKVLDLFFEPLA